MNTVPLPTLAVHMLVLQQAVCMPLSSTRTAGSLFTLTSVEPMIAGPTAGCGQAGQPCAHTGILDLSPSLHWPGMGSYVPRVWGRTHTMPPGGIVAVPTAGSGLIG